jgi:16S rRNA (guanine966-N2)-methyltransferase
MGDRRSTNRGRLRIIGGLWRSRKLHIVETPGLRPTPDRVRETLFNWLSAETGGSRCLDLFSGSGALGLEALSRGAVHCVFIDTAGAAITAIRQHLDSLGCNSADTHQCDGLRWLQDTPTPEQAFDIVFLDPPFQQNLLAPACELLEARAWLAPAAHIYLESGAREETPKLPPGWTLKREKLAGEVRYQLFVRRG